MPKQKRHPVPGMDVMLDEFEANPLVQRMLAAAARPIRPGEGIPHSQVLKEVRRRLKKSKRAK